MACPKCQARDIELYARGTPSGGWEKRWHCNDCGAGGPGKPPRRKVRQAIQLRRGIR